MTQKVLSINLTDRQNQTLTKIKNGRKIAWYLHDRAVMILKWAHGESMPHIAKALEVKRDTVSHWIKRWLINSAVLTALEAEEKQSIYMKGIIKILSDMPRKRATPKYSREQIEQIIAISHEDPLSCGYSASVWNSRLLRLEVLKRKIVSSISKTQVGRFLEKNTTGRINRNSE